MNDTMKKVFVPPVDMNGSRPGIQKGPSAGDVAWMGIRRGAKFVTAFGADLLGQRIGLPAGAGAGSYLITEKVINESIHRKTGKHNDVDPIVIIIELIKQLVVIWIRSRKSGQDGG
jgi:hypothetical protein